MLFHRWGVNFPTDHSEWQCVHLVCAFKMALLHRRSQQKPSMLCVPPFMWLTTTWIHMVQVMRWVHASVCVCLCLCMCLLLQFVTSVVPVSACLRSLRCSDHINPNVHSRVGLRQTVTKLRCGRNMTCQGLVVYVYHSDHSGYFPSVRSISPFWGSSNRVALSMFPPELKRISSGRTLIVPGKVSPLLWTPLLYL